MQKRMEQIDSETGEILDGFVAYIAPKKTNGFVKGWMAMAQDAADLIAESNLEGKDLKVLFKLIAKLDFENLLVVNQAQMARDLGMRRQHVQRSIKHLISLGIILEGVKIGVSRSYRLNPSFGWKGSAENHQSALKKRMDNVGLSVVSGGKGGTEEEQTQLDI